MSATLTPAEDVDVPPRRRRMTGKLLAVLVAASLVLAGAVTAAAVSFHYLHAKPLSCSCAVGWMPSERGMHHVRGVYEDASIVDNSADNRHGFFVMVGNDSSVTQTVLGATDDFFRPQLSYGVETDYRNYSADNMHWANVPLVLHPGDVRYLRVSFGGCVPRGGTLGIRSLTLIVRSGAFTRTEKVDFGSFALGLRAHRYGCAH